MNKQQLKEYIAINHHFMTMQEMADETKESYGSIAYICKKHGYHPITIGERVRDFIIKNKNLSLQEQADKLGITLLALNEHYSKTGTPLPEITPVKEEKSKLSISAQEFIKETIKSIKKRNDINRKQFTVYNQSGSDILDEHRGIKTTERNHKLL